MTKTQCPCERTSPLSSIHRCDALYGLTLLGHSVAIGTDPARYVPESAMVADTDLTWDEFIAECEYAHEETNNTKLHWTDEWWDGASLFYDENTERPVLTTSNDQD